MAGGRRRIIGQSRISAVMLSGRWPSETLVFLLGSVGWVINENFGCSLEVLAVCYLSEHAIFGIFML